MKSKLSAALVAACITAATPFMGFPALGAACLETPATQTLGGLVNFLLFASTGLLGWWRRRQKIA